MTRIAGLVGVLLLSAWASTGHAHSGPPYPILSNRIVNGYDISIWTDPDATDDGSAGGKFWIVIERAEGKGAVPPGTSAIVSIRPLDRVGSPLTANTAPSDGSIGRQYAALLMDHEGRFAVSVRVTGPAGEATVESAVDATYDLRPPPYMLAIYLLPFVAVGGLWIKLMLRRRASRRGEAGGA